MKKSLCWSLLGLFLSLSACQENKPPVKLRTVKSGNLTINHTDNGKGDVTLVFIHGAYIDQSYWTEQIRYFSREYRVITLDLPGHGLSGRDRNTWTVAQFGRDLVALLDQLDLHHVVLIGHSMGGDVALEAAVARPARIIGLIGIDNFKNAATPLPEAQTAQIMEQLGREFANTNERYVRMGLVTPGTDSALVQRVIDDYRNAYQPMGLPMTQDIFFNVYQREKALLPQLAIKLYLINVDYFPTNETPLRELAGASYELIPMHGTSHFPMIENPGELNRLLEQTIHKITAGR